MECQALDLAPWVRFMIEITKGKRMEKLNIDIQGMTCASCVRRVEKKLSKNPHIQNTVVNLATEQVSLEYDKKKCFDKRYFRNY